MSTTTKTTGKNVSRKASAPKKRVVEPIIEEDDEVVDEELDESGQEVLTEFQGRKKVTHIKSDTGDVYFANSESFDQMQKRTGCNWFEIDEEYNRLMCFAGDDECGNYYLVQALRDDYKDESELAEAKHSLQFVDTWYEEEQRWCPIVCKANKHQRSKKAVAV